LCNGVLIKCKKMSTKYAFDIMIELVEIVDMKFVSSPPNVRAQRAARQALDFSITSTSLTLLSLTEFTESLSHPNQCNV